MLFKRDFTGKQFVNLSHLYAAAELCLQNLNRDYPEYKNIWDIVRNKMNIVKETITADEVPTDARKRDADLTTMLSFELRDFQDANAILPLYELDRAFTLLGMKDIEFKS
jgi:hypothetical protein